MSTNVDVQNRNSAEVIDGDANIFQQTEGEPLKTGNDMEATEQCRLTSDNTGQSPRPPNKSDSAMIDASASVENSVDDNSNSNVSLVDVDNIVPEVASNDNDVETTVDGEKVIVEQSSETVCQDTTLVSPSDSGSAQADSLSTTSCEGLASESSSSPNEASITESNAAHTVDVESPGSTTESSGQSAADVPMPQVQPTENEHLLSAEPSSSRAGPSTYHIKWIKFQNVSVPIITQNENGPCPLIAIMNVLLLQRKVKLPPMMQMVTSSQLMDYLADCILEFAPQNMSDDAVLNYQQNMQDAMAVFHKLQTGLDVNVKFTGISAFEYTSECIVFDLLGIPLFHGWLVDPENIEEVQAVGQCSYNQLVEKIIAQKSSPYEEEFQEAVIAEEFLDRTAHQLTYHGLSELASTLRDQQLCVFFRNNHFSTLYKHKDELFLLVTDQGYLTESDIVWETLSNVEGDGEFVGASFRTYHKSEPSNQLPAAVLERSSQQIDQDFLVALSLQQEQQQAQFSSTEWQPTLSDHELALKLQEEENRRAAAALQRQDENDGSSSNGPQSSTSHPQRQSSVRGSSRESNKKNSECVIL